MCSHSLSSQNNTPHEITQSYKLRCILYIFHFMHLFVELWSFFYLNFELLSCGSVKHIEIILIINLGHTNRLGRLTYDRKKVSYWFWFFIWEKRGSPAAFNSNYPLTRCNIEVKKRGECKRDKYRDKSKICQCVVYLTYTLIRDDTDKLSNLIFLLYRQTETPWSIHFAVASTYLQC